MDTIHGPERSLPIDPRAIRIPAERGEHGGRRPSSRGFERALSGAAPGASGPAPAEPDTQRVARAIADDPTGLHVDLTA